MKSTKNIVILTPGFPESIEDTTCIPALQALIFELKKSYGDKINIRVVAFQYPFKKGTYNWNGITCFSAGGNNIKFPFRWKTWTTVIRHLKKYHENYHIDVIHAFWLNECALVGSWIASLTGARLICHVMGQDVLPANKYLKILKLKNAVIIANSPYSAGLLERNSSLKAGSIIPFGINPEEFVLPDPEKPRQIHVLGVGALSEIKNFELFVELFSKLKNEFPEIRGKIIGGGPKYDQLKKMINNFRLNDSLLLTGQLQRNEVLGEMLNSKVLLHTSSFESAGYVFPEALFSGMKVISFNTGYLPQVQGAYPCEDADEMLRTLKSLFTYTQTYTRKEVPLISETADAVFKLYLAD